MLSLILLAVGITCFGQTKLPVLRANSRTISIRDGKHFRAGYWAVMPEKKPDIYYKEIPQRPGKVTFITDLDSITFDLNYKKTCDFIVLLNGKDSCYTRISATYKDLHSPNRKENKNGPDTIPLDFGQNAKAYVSAVLNGSTVKNNQLDLGAGSTVINAGSVKKVKINFDSKINVANSDGVNQVQSASRNRLQIGNLSWDSIPVAVVKNMKPHEDLIIGNSLFKGKVMELNYDKKILIVHDTLPSLASTFKRNDLVLEAGVLPLIRVKLSVGDKQITGWALFDTGARTTIISNSHISRTYSWWTAFAALFGLEASIEPKITINNQQISGFEYKTRNMGDNDQLHMILGQDLLKRFNIVLDNINGEIYLQPNSLQKEPYRKRGEYYELRFAAALVLLVPITIYVMKRRKRAKNRANF